MTDRPPGRSIADTLIMRQARTAPASTASSATIRTITREAIAYFVASTVPSPRKQPCLPSAASVTPTTEWAYYRQPVNTMGGASWSAPADTELLSSAGLQLALSLPGTTARPTIVKRSPGVSAKFMPLMSNAANCGGCAERVNAAAAQSVFAGHFAPGMVVTVADSRLTRGTPNDVFPITTRCPKSTVIGLTASAAICDVTGCVTLSEVAPEGNDNAMSPNRMLDAVAAAELAAFEAPVPIPITNTGI
jgi:hypothetical protein